MILFILLITTGIVNALSWMLVSILFLSSPVLAGMTPEERCEEQGDVAEKASNLRIAGDDKETAIDTLTKEYAHSGTSITAQNIRGLVTVSYMAKMKPEKMRDYASPSARKIFKSTSGAA